VDLRRQIAIIRPWLPLLIVTVLLAGAVAFALSSVLPKTYEAKTTLIVGQSLSVTNPDINALLVSQRLSTTYATIATKRPILDTVVKELGLGGQGSDLAKRVRADAPLDSTLLTISAQDADPARAAAIANTLAAQLIAASPAIQGREADIQASIDAEVAATQSQIQETEAQVEALSGLAERTPKQDSDLDALEGRLVSMRSTLAALLSISSGNASNLLTVIEPAIAPTDAISPNRLQNTVLAAVLGLLVVTGLIVLLELLYDGVRDSDGVSEATGLSTLGAIARMKPNRSSSEMYQLAALLYPRSGVAEAYRTLRTNVEFSSVDAPIRTLLVTSSVTGEGKTVTAANLAVVFAQAGRRTLLVDADLRKPGTHIIFDLPNAHGLTTLLRSSDASLNSLTQSTEQENLRVLTTGPIPPNPAELVGSQRMRTVVELLKGTEDLVIFDSPPLQAVTDAAILGSFLDATVFVIDAKRSRRRVIRQAREALAKADANVLGAVLNRVPSRATPGNSPYYGGYGRYDEAAVGPAPMSDASR
jgi:polysaccharide biosynthesis transport protein